MRIVTISLLALALACAPNDRRSVEKGSGGGDGNGNGDAGGEEDAAEEADAPTDTGFNIREVGGPVRPDCVDADRDNYGVGDGCEGPDTDDTDHRVYPGAPEICDGKDNDGQGGTDQDDANFRPEECPLSTGVCRNSFHPCNGGLPQPCGASTYGEGYREVEDRICDGLDNDCNGVPDEGCDCVDGQSQTCEDDGCADQRCVDGRWGTCIRARNEEPESCDGIDNDCDGDTDEAAAFGQPRPCGRCPYDMMLVDTNNLDVCIDQYEASRPDATAVSPGNINDKPTSRAGVLPWTVVDRHAALGACRSVGKELCTAAQWVTACIYIGKLDADLQWRYPYGRSYVAERCNGADAGNARAMPTGALPECVIPEIEARPAFDLSGNVREWIKEEIEDKRAAYGGSYEDAGPNMACESRDLLDARHSDQATGFRCCIPQSAQ